MPAEKIGFIEASFKCKPESNPAEPFMYIYLFQDGKFLEEIAVLNYSTEEVEELKREIKSKYGNVEIFSRENRAKNLRIKDFKNK